MAPVLGQRRASGVGRRSSVVGRRSSVVGRRSSVVGRRRRSASKASFNFLAKSLNGFGFKILIISRRLMQKKKVARQTFMIWSQSWRVTRWFEQKSPNSVPKINFWRSRHFLLSCALFEALSGQFGPCKCLQLWKHIWTFYLIKKLIVFEFQGKWRILFLKLHSIVRVNHYNA